MFFLYLWLAILLILILMLLGKAVLKCKGTAADWSSYDNVMLALFGFVILPIWVLILLVKKTK